MSGQPLLQALYLRNHSVWVTMIVLSNWLAVHCCTSVQKVFGSRRGQTSFRRALLLRESRTQEVLKLGKYQRFFLRGITAPDQTLCHLGGCVINVRTVDTLVVVLTSVTSEITTSYISQYISHLSSIKEVSSCPFSFLVLGISYYHLLPQCWLQLKCGPSFSKHLLGISVTQQFTLWPS